MIKPPVLGSLVREQNLQPLDKAHLKGRKAPVCHYLDKHRGIHVSAAPKQRITGHLDFTSPVMALLAHLNISGMIGPAGKGTQSIDQAMLLVVQKGTGCLDSHRYLRAALRFVKKDD